MVRLITTVQLRPQAVLHSFPNIIVGTASTRMTRAMLHGRRSRHLRDGFISLTSKVVDVYLQLKRDGAAAKRFFRRLLKRHGDGPRTIVTDKMRSYGVANRELIPEALHSTKVYENNRAEQSHESTRMGKQGMRKFKSARQVQQFLTAHAAIPNVFNLGCHLIRAETFRHLRERAFAEWKRAVA
jgi:putative transposase